MAIVVVVTKTRFDIRASSKIPHHIPPPCMLCPIAKLDVVVIYILDTALVVITNIADTGCAFEDI